jgi:hypothetical protein
MPEKLSQEIISAAIEGFEAQKVRIDAQIAELRASLSGPGTETVSSSAPLKRRTMSASARGRIAAAQRKRWGEAKRLAAGGSATAAKAPRRRLSAAGRRRIIEANKKRWELAKTAAELEPHGPGAGPRILPPKVRRKGNEGKDKQGSRPLGKPSRLTDIAQNLS